VYAKVKGTSKEAYEPGPRLQGRQEGFAREDEWASSDIASEKVSLRKKAAPTVVSRWRGRCAGFGKALLPEIKVTSETGRTAVELRMS
jgi:hypothetical protein